MHNSFATRDRLAAMVVQLERLPRQRKEGLVFISQTQQTLVVKQAIDVSVTGPRG